MWWKAYLTFPLTEEHEVMSPCPGLLRTVLVEHQPQVRQSISSPWGSLDFWGSPSRTTHRLRDPCSGGQSSLWDTVEDLLWNQRWADEGIKPVWVGTNVRKWREKRIEGLCWQSAGWYPSLCFRWWAMLFSPIHL